MRSMAWGGLVLALACSCSEIVENENVALVDNDYATISATDVSAHTDTRAIAGMTFEQFSLYIFRTNGVTVTKSNLIYKTGDAWNNTNAWKMVTTGNMNAYGISPSDEVPTSMHFVGDDGKACDDIYFDYTVPTTNQTMIKIGSNLGFSRKSTGGHLSMNFVNAMSTLSLRAKNNLKLKINGSEEKLAVRVNVKGAIVHNLNSQGRFTFDKTKSSKGAWTLSTDTYFNYPQDFASAKSIDSLQFTSLLDESFVVLPQNPSSWSPSGTEDGPDAPISTADAEHKTYVELKCNMQAYIDGQWQYVWGDAETFPSIYTPFVKKQLTVKFVNINTNGMYSIILQENAVLDQYGHPIKPQTTGGNDSFQDAEFVNFSTSTESGVDVTDDWGTPEETTIEF